jgi:hypothetical protein
LGFSQNRFLSNRKEVFPLFLQNGWTDRLENFSISSSAKLGAYFFFLRNLVSKKLAAFTKFILAKKKGFWQWLQYFASPDVYRRYFSKKKYKPRLGSVYLKKNFSSIP